MSWGPPRRARFVADYRKARSAEIDEVALWLFAEMTVRVAPVTRS